MNSEDARGRTALQLAAKKKRLNTVKELLRAGAHVNKTKKCGRNALQGVLVNSPRSRSANVLSTVLFAAGENAGGKVEYDQIQQLIRAETEPNLKQMCRKAIRKHLLEMSPVNLYCTVPQLGLPSLLNECLLFGVTMTMMMKGTQT